MFNQDRHFLARVRLLREGEFGLPWMPALVIGVSDPTTAKGDFEYTSWEDVNGIDNGFFNRNYIVLSKHFNTSLGEIGVHVGYLFNKREDYPLNAPCVGVNWHPVWFQGRGFFDGLNLVAEYDARTLNIGFIASLLNDHFEAMFELQNFQWVNLGVRYRFALKR